MLRTGTIEQVRTVLAKVLGEAILSWPVGRPIGDASGVSYGNITRVEAVAVIEDQSGFRAQDVTPEDLTTIAAIARFATQNS